MVEYKKGYFARSLAGHDKGRLYVIIEEGERTKAGEYVLLCDGRLKTLDKPKKKKKKHIQVIHTADEQIENLIRNGQPIKNEDIKRAIKTYNGKHNEMFYVKYSCK